MTFTPDQLTNIPNTLSQPRFTRYLQHCSNDREKALELYQWNLELSASFIVPLHLLEISVRNAVVDALSSVYTENWPWDQNFLLSLPAPTRGYNPRNNLLHQANMPNPTMGKVVAELKFVFWEKMFRSRFDERIWKPHIKKIFPNAPTDLRVSDIRQQIFNDIQSIRRLRNRIAHYEPIFTRDIEDDYNKIYKLVSWRDITTANWMD